MYMNVGRFIYTYICIYIVYATIHVGILCMHAYMCACVLVYVDKCVHIFICVHTFMYCYTYTGVCI